MRGQELWGLIDLICSFFGSNALKVPGLEAGIKWMV